MKSNQKLPNELAQLAKKINETPAEMLKRVCEESATGLWNGRSIGHIFTMMPYITKKLARAELFRAYNHITDNRPYKDEEGNPVAIQLWGIVFHIDESPSHLHGNLIMDCIWDELDKSSIQNLITDHIKPIYCFSDLISQRYKDIINNLCTEDDPNIRAELNKANSKWIEMLNQNNSMSMESCLFFSVMIPKTDPELSCESGELYIHENQKLIYALFSSALERAKHRTGIRASVEFAGIGSKAILQLRNNRRYESLKDLVSHVGNGARLAITPAIPDENPSHTEIGVTLHAPSGRIRYGQVFVSQYDEDPVELAKDIANALKKDPRVNEVIVHAISRRPQIHGTLKKRASLYKDLEGNWVKIDEAMLGSAKKYIRNIGWEELNIGMEKDDSFRKLPWPQRILGMGVEQRCHEHFSQDVFNTIRQLASDPQATEDEFYSNLFEKYPELRELDSDIPEITRMFSVDFQAIQFKHAEGRNFIVRGLLLEQLEKLDFGKDVQADILRTPYPISYFHYEKPIEIEYAGEFDLLRIEGILVQARGDDLADPLAGTKRELNITLVASKENNDSLFEGFFPFTIKIFDEDTTTDELIAQTIIDSRSTYPDSSEDELNGLLTIAINQWASVLIYMDLHSAKITEGKDRTEAIALMNKLSGSKKEKARKNIAKKVDYIFIGGTGSEEDVALPGVDATGRTVKPHWRRAYSRWQAYGPGRSLRKRVRIKTILVNASKLGTNEQAPSKDYIVG